MQTPAKPLNYVEPLDTSDSLEKDDGNSWYASDLHKNEQLSNNSQSPASCRSSRS